MKWQDDNILQEFASKRLREMFAYRRNYVRESFEEAINDVIKKPTSDNIAFLLTTMEWFELSVINRKGENGSVKFKGHYDKWNAVTFSINQDKYKQIGRILQNALEGKVIYE